MVQQRRDHNQRNPQTLRRPRQSAYSGKLHPSRALRVPAPIFRHRRRRQPRRHKSRHGPAPARRLAQRELGARRRRRRHLPPSQPTLLNTAKKRKHRKPRRQSDAERRWPSWWWRAAASKRVGQPRAAEPGHGRCLDVGGLLLLLSHPPSPSSLSNSFFSLIPKQQLHVSSPPPKNLLFLSLLFGLGLHHLGVGYRAVRFDRRAK
jgi:hypothetical protein